MRADEQTTFLILLNEGDLESAHGITYLYRKHFNLNSDSSIEGVATSLYNLEKIEAVFRFDIEYDGDLDTALLEHSAHGDIDFKDLTIIGLEEKFGLGRRAIEYAFEYRDKLSELAIDLGLNNAAEVLTNLPVDSQSWTGFDSGIRLDEQLQFKLLKMLREAETTLAKSMSNDRDVAQGLAYVRSAIILSEAPIPPKKDIWTMINRASSIAGLAGMFAPILAIFTKQ